MKGSELVSCLIGYENIKTIKNWLRVTKYYFKNILINRRNNQVFHRKFLLYMLCKKNMPLLNAMYMTIRDLKIK